MRVLLQFLLFCIGFGATVYAAFCLLLYFQQDNFIFFRVANDSRLTEGWRSRRVEIQTAETVVEGWWAQNEGASNDVTILYFGGNAEDLLYTAETAKRFNARRMLLTNYRGYGATPGKPSETALLSDAVALYDYAVKQPGVFADKIVVMGRSLGSGVATYLAAQRPVCGVILVTPFDSMEAVGRSHYPLFPVRWLLKHKFASDKLARGITMPVLIIAGEQDNIIPPSHARKLFDAWAGPKRIEVLDTVGHNDLERHLRYYLSIDEFLSGPVSGRR